MDAENCFFKDNSFDIVVGQDILYHLDISQACEEITRVLKPNGRAIFIKPIGHNPIINFYRKLTPQLRSTDEQPLRIIDINYISKYFYKMDVEYLVLISLLLIPFLFFGFNCPLKNIKIEINYFE